MVGIMQTLKDKTCYYEVFSQNDDNATDAISAFGVMFLYHFSILLYLYLQNTFCIISLYQISIAWFYVSAVHMSCHCDRYNNLRLHQLVNSGSVILITLYVTGYANWFSLSQRISKHMSSTIIDYILIFYVYTSLFVNF